MSHWKAKSESYLKGAQLLVEHSLLSLSVHGAYYSNLQLIHHVFYKRLGVSPEQIKKASRKGAKKEGGSHNWLGNKAYEVLIEKGANADARAFKNTLGALKRLRVEADYHNTLIHRGKANKAIEQARKVNGILQKHFHL